jgi:hypothetical protein
MAAASFTPSGAEQIELAWGCGWDEFECAIVLRPHTEAGEAACLDHNAGVGEHRGGQVLTFHRERFDGPSALE